MKTINIAKDFSRIPGFRYRETMPFSGEEFRDEVFIPALKVGEGVCLELDGTVGFTAAFIEEVFGGAVRKGFSLGDNELKLVSEDDYLKNDIWDSIKNAAAG